MFIIDSKGCDAVPRKWLPIDGPCVNASGAVVKMEDARALEYKIRAAIAGSYDDSRLEEFLTVATALSQEQPFAALRAFCAGGGRGYFLLRGLPVGVCKSPKDDSVSESVLLAASTILGYAFGYEERVRLNVLVNVRPTRLHAGQQLGGGSVDLTWHVEDAHTLNAPDHFILFCLRGDESVVTFLHALVIETLAPKIRALLTESAYDVYPDENFLHRAPKRTSILSLRPDGKWALQYDPAFTKCATEEHAAALAALTAHFASNAEGIVLRSGDLLVVDNRLTVHARSAFQPTFDDADRWLQKVYVRRTPIDASSRSRRHPYLIAYESYL